MKQRVQPRTLFVCLSLLCLLAVWLSLALGPVSLPLFDTLRAGLRLLGLPVAADGHAHPWLETFLPYLFGSIFFLVHNRYKNCVAIVVYKSIIGVVVPDRQVRKCRYGKPAITCLKGSALGDRKQQ